MSLHLHRYIKLITYKSLYFFGGPIFLAYILMKMLWEACYYSAFQKELHKIFTNFRLPFIKSRRSDRYLSDITFQSLRPELSFGVSFMFISGHFWSADTKQKSERYFLDQFSL